MSAGSDAVGAPGRRVRWLAYLCGGFGLAMFTFVGFLVPLRARELGASYDVIGLIVGAAAIAPAVLSVPLGAVIDRLGSRRALLLGTTTGAAVSALFPLVTDHRWFLLLQPLLGVALNLGHVASQSYVTSLTVSPSERVGLTGRFSFFVNVAQMAAPIIAGASAQLLGFRWAMFVPAGYAAAFVVLTMLLPRSERPQPDAGVRAGGMGVRAARGLSRIRGIQVALVLTFVRLWVSLIFYSFLPVYLVESGFEAGLVGSVMAAAGLVAAVVAPTTGMWARLMSPTDVALLGLGLSVVALLVAPHLTTLPAVYIVPTLVGVGAGVSLPLLLSMITDAAPPDQHGVALGLRNMVNQVAASAAPIAVGALIAAVGVTIGFVTGGLAAGVLLTGARLLAALPGRADPE